MRPLGPQTPAALALAMLGATFVIGCGSSSTTQEGPPVGTDGGVLSDAPPAPTDGPLEVATPAGAVAWVGVATDRVYFALYGEAIDSVPSAGGAAPSVVTPAGASGGLYVLGVVAFDSAYVYWAEGAGGKTPGTINRAPLGGGPAQLLASSTGFIGGIAVDSGNVYWVAQDEGKVYSAPVTGGSGTVVASGLTEPAGMTIHTGTIYFTDPDGDLMTVPAGGGTVTTIVHGPGLPPNTGVRDFSPGLAVDENNVYFSQYYAPEPTLAKVPLTGGAPTVLAHASAAGIGVDAQNVYWVTGGGNVSTVNAVPIVGGAVRVLASNQSSAVGPALDTYSVYWGTSATMASCGLCPPGPTGQTTVMKAAK
jgi:hypothetical protein